MLLFPFAHFFSSYCAVLDAFDSLALQSAYKAGLPASATTKASKKSWCQLTAEEGETAKPGTRIATISPSGEGVAQDAPFEKVELQTAFPKQRENDKKEIPKEASIFQGKTKNRLSQNQLQKHLQDFHVRIDTSC
ncbi:uncharacterized protein LOC111777232 isoform X3 [Cucurbita pepo subsp. pepo]|uniref:uncharacterized protein LOC111777232 isoform X3 n=1 Tax=Cucurbita pepo subsp. pepo TaxID=3664 RepID=UPI000C9D554B|nr:uncharacterized protein LOC111777232 isoform X3 [Cucurbita pepo subsp. pepo]